MGDGVTFGDFLTMRIALISGCLGFAAALTLSGCSGSGGSGVSTASILDGSPSGATGEAVPVKNDDPNARTVQVAFTSARAQRCGFVFDSSKLRASFVAAEAVRAPNPNIEKVYDQTATTIAANAKADPDYCSQKKSAGIKADLQRHLSGNYEPNLPNQDKKVASGGFWDSLISDEPTKAFDDKTFWKDINAAKQGGKGN